MQQLKQVVHNHYPVAAIISFCLKGFVGLCRCSLVATVLSIILHCLLDWEVSWQRCSQHGLCHSYPLSSFLLGLIVSSEDFHGPSLYLLVLLTMPKVSN